VAGVEHPEESPVKSPVKSPGPAGGAAKSGASDARCREAPTDLSGLGVDSGPLAAVAMQLPEAERASLAVKLLVSLSPGRRQTVLTLVTKAATAAHEDAGDGT
jgi:hypothetical protein